MDRSKLQRLMAFVQNLEEKLNSVKSIHEKLNELVTSVTKTQRNILEELNTIKELFNEEKHRHEQQEEGKPNSEEQQLERVSLCSASSCSSNSTSSTHEQRNNSANSKRSSNLKKNDPSANRPKSPKSVTFSFEEKHEATPLPLEQIPPEENLTSSNLPKSDLIPALFKEHQQEVTHKPNIGYKLGNALTHVRIHEIESENGDYLRLLNVSNSEDYDLGGHFLQQNLACLPICRFRFPPQTIIRAGQTITIWCGGLREIEAQPPHVFLWKEQRRWETGAECVTILSKPTGQAIAWARSSNRLSSDQSSSDILFVHSQGPSHPPSSTPLRSRSRLSAFHFIGSPKPPFAHSPSSSVHPDHQADLRSQLIYSRGGGISSLLTRPKSSPFASHTGCKQDLLSANSLRKPPTTVKT